MTAKEGLKLVGGSITVYVIMAACSAGGGSPFISDDGGPADGTASTGSGGGGSSGMLDALTDPVSSASADPNQSGTRLKLMYYAGADGSKQAAGMHDSMLSLDCAFSTASDGTLRCLPFGASVAYPSSLFIDASCTQPLVAVLKGCTAPGYAYVSGTAVACAVVQTIHIYATGSLFNGTTAYTGSAKACTSYPATALASVEMEEDLYTIGSEQPPSTFVQATIQTEP